MVLVVFTTLKMVMVLRMVDSAEADMVAGEAREVGVAGVVEVRPTTIHFHPQVVAGPSMQGRIKSMSQA